jgi:HAD superfamily hydrolase (TIGR01509 family)
MDGTITRPMLDFPAIKAEMGIGDTPILEALEQMDPNRRPVCDAILLRHELAAAHGSELNIGCRGVLDWAYQQQIATALITRNSAANVRIVLEKHGLHFDAIVSRDDAAPKPDPAPLALACELLGTSAGEAWMIGDGQYDVEAGNAAGAATLWLSHGRTRLFQARPWRTVHDLVELLFLLDEEFA